VVVDLAGRAFHSASPFYHRVRAPHSSARACGSAVGAAIGAEGVTCRAHICLGGLLGGRQLWLKGRPGAMLCWPFLFAAVPTVKACG